TPSRGWRPRVAALPSRLPPNRRNSQNANASKTSTTVTKKTTLRPLCPSPNKVSTITLPCSAPAALGWKTNARGTRAIRASSAAMIRLLRFKEFYDKGGELTLHSNGERSRLNKSEQHCEKEAQRECAHNKMHDQPPSAQPTTSPLI